MNTVRVSQQQDSEDDFADVPPAIQPHAREQEPDRFFETIWENPTDKDVVLSLYVGVQPVFGPEQIRKSVVAGWSREQRTGFRTYVIPAKSKARIPSEFDQGIQQTNCLEMECGHRKTLCREATHRHAVIGGLGPQLINVRRQQYMTIAPACVAAPVPLSAPPTPAPQQSGSGDAALARALARKATK